MVYSKHCEKFQNSLFDERVKEDYSFMIFGILLTYIILYIVTPLGIITIFFFRDTNMSNNIYINM